MRTTNPTLNPQTFAGTGVLQGEGMTVTGTVNKTVVLLVLVLCGALFTWREFVASPAEAMPWVLGGALGGLVVGFVTMFKKEWSAVTAPLYAVLEGLLLGGISALYNARFHGLVFQAVLLTFGTLFVLLAAYRLGLVRATEKFRLGVTVATGAVCLIYFAGFILSLFNVRIPYIHESGLLGIGFSLVVVVIAALNLVLDFDMIEQGAKQGAPKFMEWYAGFGLLVTLVWLYLEMLRLLAKLAGRRD